jgi:spore coat protein I
MDSMNSSTGNSDRTLEQLALKVLEQYGIQPENMVVVQSGSIKTVWKIRTAGRTLCLKRLRQTIDKALFSVNAQIYVKSNGGLVPGVISDRNRQPIVQYNDQLFVLYEWINGTDLNFGSPAELRQAVQGLARFHIASMGYRPEGESRVSTKLGKWPEQYISMKNKLTSWKETAAHSPSSVQGLAHSTASTYLKSADSMINLAQQAIGRIEQSRYARISEINSGSVVLCHQDYGKGNAIALGSDIYVLDLDGVTYDLPARDLRKIIGKISENRGQWQAGTIQEILGWYAGVNPQNEDERDALFIDLLFPHWFYGLVKNQFQGGKSLKAAEIERIAKLEESKITILKTFFNRSEPL